MDRVQLFYATKLANTVCAPQQGNSCLISCLTQYPRCSITSGILLCAIGVMALAGIALLSLGILSGGLVLCAVLAGLACISLLVGITLVYQGGVTHRPSPPTPAKTLRHFEKLKEQKIRKIEELKKQKENTRLENIKTCCTLYISAQQMSLYVLEQQCEEMREAITQ